MRNTTEVAVVADKQATWTFCVPSTAETISEAVEELVHAYEGVTTPSEDFVVPEEVTMTLKSRPGNPSMKAIFDAIIENKETDDIKSTIREKNGITGQHLRAVLPDRTEQKYFIQKASIDNARVRFRLADGDVYANRTDNSTLYSDDTRFDSDTATYPPLEFLFLYAKNFDEDDVDADILIYIFVSTWTDIWFENTDIGAINRDRLRRLLQPIDDALPVAKVHRESTWWEDEMSDIF